VSPATALSITRTGDTTFVATLGTGIPPLGVASETFAPTAVGTTSFVATRTLTIGTPVVGQRSNALVVGLPQAQAPYFIGAGTVTVNGGTKALMVQSSATDLLHTYAATTQPAYTRPVQPYTPAPS
jgi:hypothetical protein